MTVHLIYAHHRPDSFNHAMHEVASNTFQQLNATVSTTDLYQLAAKQHAAVNLFGTSLDQSGDDQIREEQAKIKSSRLTVLQFPLYWFSTPGIVHNYLEQIWTPGFAYPGKFKEAPMADGRQILFSLTTQSTETDFTEKGCNGPMDKILYHLTVAFEFVGYHVLPPFVAYNVTDQTETDLTQQLRAYQSHLEKVHQQLREG